MEKFFTYRNPWGVNRVMALFPLKRIWESGPSYENKKKIRTCPGGEPDEYLAGVSRGREPS